MMQKMERRIEELEFIGKPTAKGLKLQGKSRKMRKVAIRRREIDGKFEREDYREQGQNRM